MMKYVVRFCLILFILGTLVACGGNTASEPTNPNPDTSDALSELIENENAEGDIELAVTLRFRSNASLIASRQIDCPCLEVQTVDVSTPKAKTVTAVVKVPNGFDTSQELKGKLRVRKIADLETTLFAGIFILDSSDSTLPIVVGRKPQTSKLGNFEIQDFKSDSKLMVSDASVAGLLLSNGNIWSSLVAFPESSLKAILGSVYVEEVSVDVKTSSIETELGFLLEVAGIMRLKAGQEVIALPIDGFAFKALQQTPVEAEGLSILLNQVPVNIRRLAMWQLEEARDTDMAPGWEKAKLAETVALFYRPDVDGVAYYEFGIEASAQGGYMMVSAGKHDYPIPHWDFKGKPISEELKAIASSAPARYFKLDALSYAAEDASGEKVAQIGNALVKITGLDPKAVDDAEPELGRAYTQTNTEASDSEAASFAKELIREGKQRSEIQFEAWESWQALKAQYASTYAVLIEALKREAAEDWQVLSDEAENGEGLFVAEVRTIGLLTNLRDFRLTGEGAEFVRVRRSETLENTLELQVGSVQEKLQFALELRYENGQTESLKYFLIPSELGEPTELQTLASWSAWTTYWADGKHDDQPLYYQFTFGNCAVGCGPVASAMLFAWGDYQAETGDSYWASRCALYGNCGEIAPLTQTPDVEEMIKDINGFVDTFCIGSSGATYPWDMPDASDWFTNKPGANTGTDSDYHWNSAGISEKRLREYARNSIRDRDTPAIIGTGWLSHYPMAYGYRFRSKSTFFGLGTTYDREFYVNQGWGGVDNGWVSASTWFSGEIEP